MVERTGKHQKYCAECRQEKGREYRREHYECNREKELECKREYRERNREKIIEYQREYYERNREKRLEYAREYYERNREYVNATTLARRAEAQEATRKQATIFGAWSAAEDAWLLTNWGLGVTEQAFALGRTYGSALSRRQYLRKKGLAPA